MFKPLSFRIAAAARCSALGIAALFAGSLPAAANPACTAQTTRGSWVYTCEGTLPTPTQTNTRLLGSCTASRTGYWSCTGKANLGGAVLPQTLQGQGTNNADCTGTIAYINTVAGQPAGTLEIAYVIYDNGRAIRGLPTNSGGVLACSLRRIHDGRD